MIILFPLIVLSAILFYLIGWPFAIALILNIIPIHPSLLDSSICFSLAISFTLLIAALFRPTGIWLSIFRSLFSIAYVFRLWLLLACMRQIILNANAGEIIFQIGGAITLGGSWSLGIALPLLMLLPLMIINKSLRKEAMAMCIIYLTSFFGGCAIGVYIFCFSWFDAVETYSVLTVGNALVFLFPMLLTSAAIALAIKPDRQISS